MELTEGQAAQAQRIKPAVNAFAFFQRENQAKIRADLESKGEPHALGDVQKVVAMQWRALDESTRARFDEMAAQDKIRFDREQGEKDRLAEEESARKRKEREEVVLESRMRERRVDEEAEAKPRAAPRKRELTEE